MISELKSSIGNLKRHATWGGYRGIFEFFSKAYLNRERKYDGKSIFTAEWDVLVILDACRYDLMIEVEDDYGFIDGVDTFESLGSMTRGWLQRNFVETDSDELEDLIYVCGNPHSENILDPDQFQILDEVWRYAWDEEAGTVRPRPITDRAITHGRNERFNRMIVHYMQPHVPFLRSASSPNSTLDNFGGGPNHVLDDWWKIKRGEKTEPEVWEDYKDNLRSALDDVELLVENVDADRLIISSDHGNAVGEYKIYGHPEVPLPCLRKVPWCEITTDDSGRYQPVLNEPSDEAELDIKDRLRSLGYR